MRGLAGSGRAWRAVGASGALAAAACWAATPAAAEAGEFLVEPGHTYPSFTVSHLGISTQRGRFERTRGRIVLDPAARAGMIDVTIDAATATTGNRALDAVLRESDFFDVERFPAITFRSRSVEFAGEAPRRATGDLTLRGITRPVTLEVVRFGCTRLPFFVRLTCGADVVATVRRSDFGMAAYAGLVGEEVRLEIQIEAVKQEPAAEPPPAGG